MFPLFLSVISPILSVNTRTTTRATQFKPRSSSLPWTPLLPLPDLPRLQVTAPSSHDLRWSCRTRGGEDYMYRRIASMIRRSLTVVLCLTDDEAATLSRDPYSFMPGISSCPIVRFESWSTRSLRQIATGDLGEQQSTMTPIATPSTRLATVGAGTPVASSETAGSHLRQARNSTSGFRDGGNFATASAHTDRGKSNSDTRGSSKRQNDGGKNHFWGGSTHANLVGLLAFGRFQSAVAAVKHAATPSTMTETAGASASAPGSMFPAEAGVAAGEAESMFDGWMALAVPSCVDVYRAVEMCSGGGNKGAP